MINEELTQILRMYSRKCDVRTIPMHLVWRYIQALHPRFDFQSRGTHDFDNGDKIPYLYRLSRNKRGDIIKETLVIGV
jgi:hypothetical protein